MKDKLPLGHATSTEVAVLRPELGIPCDRVVVNLVEGRVTLCATEDGQETVTTSLEDVQDIVAELEGSLLPGEEIVVQLRIKRRPTTAAIAPEDSAQGAAGEAGEEEETDDGLG